MSRKLVSYGLYLLVMLALIIFYFAEHETDFHLQDNRGNAFSSQNLQGRWSLVFFGFTHCPMMCPLTMNALQQMYSSLEHDVPQAKLPQVVLITLDPERDTQERLDEYVSAFNPRFIAARGDKKMTALLMQRFHIIAVRMQADGGKDRYTLDHGGEILVFGPDGKLADSWAFPHRPEVLANQYKAILKRA